MKYFFYILISLISFQTIAQLNDDFSDLDFTSNPSWNGSTSDFIVNTSQQVQLNATVAGTSYLSTPHGLNTLADKEWKFWAKITTSASGSNFGRFYLTAANSDLTTNPDGFYIQLGEALSTDAVRLMKREGGVTTQICASDDGSIASSFTISVRVLRSSAGDWTLFVDPTGGTGFAQVGTGNESANLLGTHSGYLCTYSAGNATKYFFDAVYAGDEIFDTASPAVVSVMAINANLIDVVFNEAVDLTSAEDENNYDIQPFLSAQTATVDLTNPALVHIVPISPLTNGNSYTLITSSIQDLAGNPSISESNTFGYFIPEIAVAGDVIINEFMCDPSPVIGLPEVEFVEVYNRSNKVINLLGWKLGDASSVGTVQAGLLLPGEFKILCSTSSLVAFPNGIAVTSFPSLNNAGDDIVLKSDLLIEIDKISYTNDWYQDDVKADGGYTIERINPNAPCSGTNNWIGSDDSNGGTPGAINSVNDLTPDTQSPSITQVFALGASEIQLSFSEGMDSTALATAQISTNPALTELNRNVSGQFPTTLEIQFNEQFAISQTYQITIQNVADCWMNFANLQGTFALADVPQIGDVVVNEILFNPLTGGSDWLELYNKSNKLLNLKDWAFANHSNDTISNVKTLTTNYLLAPNDYVVIGANPSFAIANYPVAVPDKFLTLTLPSLNTDSSTIYVLAPIPFTNGIMDKVSYTDKWHFKLIDDDKGKSLERLDPDGPSQAASNWHTAAEAIGFGTPGRENSQFYPAITSGTLSFTSETFSPDNDGFEDVMQINYELEINGLVGHLKIYDDRGRLIRDLVKSELLSAKGTIVWDGVDDSNNKASIGTYVVIFEAFQVNGGLEYVAKKAIVLAGKI